MEILLGVVGVVFVLWLIWRAFSAGAKMAGEAAGRELASRLEDEITFDFDEMTVTRSIMIRGVPHSATEAIRRKKGVWQIEGNDGWVDVPDVLQATFEREYRRR